MTSKVPHYLYIELENWYGDKGFAQYANFTLGSAADHYKMSYVFAVSADFCKYM